MRQNRPPVQHQLLAEGRTKRGAETVLAQALRPDEHSDDPGLIYVSPELVSDIKECKYGLGWDTSYKNCHRGLSPISVPLISIHLHPQRPAYHTRLVKAPNTTFAYFHTGGLSPDATPNGCFALISPIDCSL